MHLNLIAHVRRCRLVLVRLADQQLQPLFAIVRRHLASRAVSCEQRRSLPVMFSGRPGGGAREPEPEPRHGVKIILIVICLVLGLGI